MQEINNIFQIPIKAPPEATPDQAKKFSTFDQSNSHPKIIELLANAEILVKHKEIALAKGLLREVFKHDSENVIAIRRLASLLSSPESRDEKLQLLRRLVQIENNFENLVLLANQEYAMGLDKLALEHFRSALATMDYQTSQVFDVYKNIGNILVREGDFDGAEENYNIAFGIHPESDVLLVNLGTLNIQQNDFEQALQRFRQAVTFNPRNDKAWVGLGLVHRQMGDTDLAAANFIKAADVCPGNRTAVQLAAQLLISAKRNLEAAGVVSSYLATVQQDTEMSIVLIHAFTQMGKFDLAAMELERALLWDAESPSLQAIEKELMEDRP